MTKEEEEEVDGEVTHAFLEEDNSQGQKGSKGKDVAEDSDYVSPKDGQPAELEDSEEELPDNDDVHLATKGDASEEQQGNHKSFHRDVTSVLSAEKQYTKQEDGRDVQASEDTTNLLPQNVKSEKQDDAEEALPQEAKIVPDAASVDLETSYLGQQTYDKEPVALKSEVDPSSTNAIKASADHTCNPELSEPENVVKQVVTEVTEETQSRKISTSRCHHKTNPSKTPPMS